jgi:hypothetical protein
MTETAHPTIYRKESAMSLTRKHFKAMAEAINAEAKSLDIGSEEYLMVRRIAFDLATISKSENPNFDRAKFLQACGVSES